MSVRKIVLIGSGGLGRETLWGLRMRDDCEVLGFLTSNSEELGGEVCDLPVLGTENWLFGRADIEAVCCIGDPRKRIELVRRLEAHGVCFGRAIHPSAEMSRYVEIGEGSIVGARCVLTSQVSIGRHSVVGVGAVVSHDCVLEDFATLAPGVVLAGSVHVEYGAELGVAVAAKPGCRVGRGSLVGANAAVVEDITANTVATGVPARVQYAFPEETSL